MKRYIISSLTAVSLLTTSCEKFLESESPSVFTDTYIYSNSNDAAKAVYGVYALFNQDAFTSRVSNNFAGNSDIEVGGVSANPDNSRRDIWSFETTPSNQDLLTVWNNAFKAINRANECIEGIESSDLYKSSDRTMTQLRGEAAGLRAIWYWYLINHWGDVPLKTTPTKAGDEFYLPRTDRNEILTFLIDDLKAIEPKMMWAEELDYGIERINREFVIGMIARLSMMRGGYALYPDMSQKRAEDWEDYYRTANEYCKKLVSLKPHVLTPNYAQVFLNVNKYIKPKNEDVLYEVAFHPGFGDVAWNMGVRVDAGSHPYGSGSNYLSLTPSYYYSFDDKDKRRDVTCSIVFWDKDLLQQPVAITAIAPNKWNRLLVPTPLGAASAKGTGINWPLMRYADVLLMLAESENALNGPNATAQQYLKEVRKRAFDPADHGEKVDAYVASVSGSRETFFEAIVNERGWEFGGEALRKYDLIRWGNYGKKLAETRRTLLQMGMDQYTGTGQYANLADDLYYKRNEDGSITFLNRLYDPAVIPPVKDSPNKGDNPNGYLRAGWLKSTQLYNSQTSSAGDFVARTWRGYADNTGQTPVRYILPVHATIVTSSMGVLNNDGYGFGF
ncbi:RagB/SusD family nutrient uptake outer membrane protein [Pedobacter sp. SYSU D00535]|uniref:RagB/SusD family nutrient uptake outer membrane protein n=1 Tax=Pedobacter sp. SYSU D00535 TaxID=2810308 RepID=UPI001A97C1DA|nr:RagB/SusD family nutrient uptake outer membrane protein [Pedobacter sp. SYSU D00535]